MHSNPSSPGKLLQSRAGRLSLRGYVYNIFKNLSNSTLVKHERGSWESQEHLAQALQTEGITGRDVITQHEGSCLGKTWGTGEAALVFTQQRATQPSGTASLVGAQDSPGP